IVALPVCAAWGASKDEAITFVTQTARAYVRRLRDTGVPVLESVKTSNTPVVAVTLLLFFSRKKEYDGKEIFRNPDQRGSDMQTPQRGNFSQGYSLGRPYHQDAQHLSGYPIITHLVSIVHHVRCRHAPDGLPQESTLMAQTVVVLKRAHFFSI